MVQRTKLSFTLVGSLLIVSVLFHIVLMRGAVPFDQKYVLYANLFLLLILWPSASLLRDHDHNIVIEDTFKTAFKVLPLWMIIVLGSILLYSAVVFVNFTYFDSPTAAGRNSPVVLDKLAKGSSAATMFFYAAVFGLMNLKWRAKRKDDLTPR